MLSWELAEARSAAAVAVVWPSLLRHGMLEAPGGCKLKGPGAEIQKWAVAKKVPKSPIAPDFSDPL